MTKSHYWMLVVKDLQHLTSLQEGNRSWWCVSNKYTYGDHAFIYKPGTGILYYIKLGSKLSNKTFCMEHKLETANIEVIKKFESPLTVKLMRLNEVLNKEAFMRRQFQGSTFVFESVEAAQEILRLASQNNTYQNA